MVSLVKDARRAAIAIVLLLAFPLGCGSLIPSKDALMRRGETLVQPLIAALEAFHARHQRYPRDLDILVADGLIQSIPVIPDVAGAEKRDLCYRVNLETDFYYLSFSYDLPEGFGPGAIYTHFYISDRGHWETSKYPPCMPHLVAGKAGRLFRDHHSSKFLDLFFESEIEAALIFGRCVNLWKVNIVEGIGDGQPARVMDKEGVLYESQDGGGKAYFLMYQSKTFSVPRGKVFDVANEVYILDPSQGPEWKLRASCQ